MDHPHHWARWLGALFAWPGMVLAAPPAQTPVTMSRAAREESDAALHMVKAWARAWDRNDVHAYLAHYASDFAPEGGQTREQWERQRRARMEGGPRHVMLRELKVDVDVDRAEVRFVQHYLDLNVISTADKRLLLAKRDGHWKILRELVESEKAVKR